MNFMKKMNEILITTNENIFRMKAERKQSSAITPPPYSLQKMIITGLFFFLIVKKNISAEFSCM